MGVRNEDLSLPEGIQRTEEQLHLYDDLVAAFNDPIAMLEVLLSAEDPADARLGLAQEVRPGPVQARAVLDLSFRRATKLDQTRIRKQCEDLAEQITTSGVLPGTRQPTRSQSRRASTRQIESVCYPGGCGGEDAQSRRAITWKTCQCLGPL